MFSLSHGVQLSRFSHYSSRVARQISWGTSDSAPSPKVIFGLCGSRSLMFPWQRSYACAVAHRAEKDSGEQHFTEQAHRQKHTRIKLLQNSTIMLVSLVYSHTHTHI